MKKSKKFIALCKKYGVNPDNVREILSFEAACKDQKVNPKKLPIVKDLPKVHREYMVSHYKSIIIAQALRGNNNFNYTDGSAKYNAVHRVHADAKRPAGFGFSHSNFVS